MIKQVHVVVVGNLHDGTFQEKVNEIETEDLVLGQVLRLVG